MLCTQNCAVVLKIGSQILWYFSKEPVLTPLLLGESRTEWFTNSKQRRSDRMSFSRLGYKKTVAFTHQETVLSLITHTGHIAKTSRHIWRVPCPCGKELIPAKSHVRKPRSRSYSHPAFRWLQCWPPPWTQPQERPPARITSSAAPWLLIHRPLR